LVFLLSPLVISTDDPNASAVSTLNLAMYACAVQRILLLARIENSFQKQKFISWINENSLAARRKNRNVRCLALAISGKPSVLWHLGCRQQRNVNAEAGCNVMGLDTSIPLSASRLCREVMAAIDIFHGAKYWRRLVHTIF
jgi:hypothetical protein